MSKLRTNLKHSGNQIVDGFFSVTPVSALLEGMSLVVESTLGGGELERPKEVVGQLEVGSDSVKFVDQIFNADDLLGAKNLFNNFVGSDGDSLLVDLTVSSLVDQVRDGVLGGITVSNKRLDLLDHVKSSSVDSDEDSIMYLSKSEQLKDLSDLGSKVVNTSDSDHKDDLRFSGNVERTFSSSLSLKVNDVLLFLSKLLRISFSSLGVFSSLSFLGFLSLSKESLSSFSELGVSGSLLEVGLGDVLLGLFDVHRDY